MTNIRPNRIRIALIACVLCLALPAAASANVSARNELLRIRDQIENELRNSPEMRRAVLDARDARREYVLARRAATAALEKDSDYLASRLESDQLQEELDAIYHRYRYGVAPIERTHPLAKRILAIRSEATEMRAEAMIQHVATQETRARFVEAGRRLAALRRSIPDAIRRDPRFQRLRGTR